MTVTDQIHSILSACEQAYQVKVVYACESGSRAWGFPSANSDYDVRFIYLHPRDWYLSIEDRRDVIELPIHDQLDISGWDLRKALQLFRRSNAPLLEWLGSPIVYWERYQVIARLRELAGSAYSPVTCIYRYLRMARENYRLYMQGDQARLKAFFYTLRPILAINWIEHGLGVVPTPLAELVEGVVRSGALKAEIQQLVDLKLAGNEVARGPRPGLLSAFIDQEMERLQDYHAVNSHDMLAYDTLDAIFRSGLLEAWG